MLPPSFFVSLLAVVCWLLIGWEWTLGLLRCVTRFVFRAVSFVDHAFVVLRHAPRRTKLVQELARYVHLRVSSTLAACTRRPTMPRLD